MQLNLDNMKPQQVIDLMNEIIADAPLGERQYIRIKNLKGNPKKVMTVVNTKPLKGTHL